MIQVSVGLAVAVLAAGSAPSRAESGAGSVAGSADAAPAAVDATDRVEIEYRKLLAEDDAAQAEVDQWIRENKSAKEEGPDFTSVTLNARIEQRTEPVRRAYRSFLERHPKHVRARLAFASFLNDVGQDEEAFAQFKEARDLDPKNPAVWNNLADYHSRHGPTRLAFECLDEAIRLKPGEPVYHRNLATLLFLFRKEAQAHYRLADEQQVLPRALESYRKARRLDPGNFPLATDLAQVYYYLKPDGGGDPAALKASADKLADEGLRAWHDARALARSDLDREGIAVHLARICLTAGRLDQARQHLAQIQHPSLDTAKQALESALERFEKGEPVPSGEF